MDAVLAGNSTTVDLNLGSSIKNATMVEIKNAMAATVANCFFHFNTNAIKFEELKKSHLHSSSIFYRINSRSYFSELFNNSFYKRVERTIDK